MNEVDSSNIREEMKQLAETKASGKTGFQEKFEVCIHAINFALVVNLDVNRFTNGNPIRNIRTKS